MLLSLIYDIFTNLPIPNEEDPGILPTPYDP